MLLLLLASLPSRWKAEHTSFAIQPRQTTTGNRRSAVNVAHLELTKTGDSWVNNWDSSVGDNWDSSVDRERRARRRAPPTNTSDNWGSSVGRGRHTRRAP